jgi:hypothetical protein
MASLANIRSRIVGRGSFSFPESELANATIIRTLNAMTDEGEIRCVESGPQWLWQRITPTEGIDVSQ